jgi:CheY-like chemotaxis protein
VEPWSGAVHSAMMNMSKKSSPLCKPDQQHLRPSERTARALLGIRDWFHDIFTSTSNTVPRGQVFHHRGDQPGAGKELQFPQILLVEDNPQIAADFIEAIKSFYVFGAVSIFVAYAYEAAVTFFDNEDISLVIMDADLDDEAGDGATLISRFLQEKPDIIILANSSSRISNLKLTGYGAVDTLGKSKDKLRNWLRLNDPAGASG